jgi:hypothetical protein
MSKLHVFITTTNGDYLYNNFKLMFSAGKQNAGPGYVGAIASPEPVKNITIPATLPDPVFFSYPYNPEGGPAIVRGLLAKITSEGGEIPSSCVLHLVEVPDPASDVWRYDLSEDIVLKYLEDPDDPDSEKIDLLTNPQGIAVIGDYILGLDYDSQLLTILGVNELLGQSGNYIPAIQPYDMSLIVDYTNYRGRAIIALGNKLYPLFINYYEVDPDVWEHWPGCIARFDVSGTTPSGGIKSIVGKNPQEVVPGIDGSGNTWLFIPAIGGEQLTDDADTIATNGTDSNICILPAEGTWPDPAPTLLTGDPKGSVGLATAYDIHDTAIVFRDGNSPVFILTAMYNGVDYYQLYYNIYLSTVDRMLTLRGLPSPPTLSQAEAGKVITLIDRGVITTDKNDPAGLYHPSINIIQHPADPEKDLIVVCTGSMTLITRVLAYGSPTAEEVTVLPPMPPESDSGTDPDPATPPVSSKNNPYTLFGNAGGMNMNSIDITIETLYQAMRGDVSLKRGGRMSRPGGAAGQAATSAARLGTPAPAAPAAPTTPAKEEEEK